MGGSEAERLGDVTVFDGVPGTDAFAQQHVQGPCFHLQSHVVSGLRLDYLSSGSVLQLDLPLSDLLASPFCRHPLLGRHTSLLANRKDWRLFRTLRWLERYLVLVTN